MKVFLRILILCSVCYVSFSYAEEVEGQKQLEVAISNTKTALILVQAKFSGKLEIEKVAYECSMLQSITDSILVSAKAFSLNIEYQESADPLANDKDTLVVELENVNPNKWGVMQVRPHSEATIKATVFHKGVPVDVFSRKIGSAVSIGACDRLEKIATTGGREVAKWASKRK
jgi:hypothetical protein